MPCDPQKSHLIKAESHTKATEERALHPKSDHLSFLTLNMASVKQALCQAGIDYIEQYVVDDNIRQVSPWNSNLLSWCIDDMHVFVVLGTKWVYPSCCSGSHTPERQEWKDLSESRKWPNLYLVQLHMQSARQRFRCHQGGMRHTPIACCVSCTLRHRVVLA